MKKEYALTFEDVSALGPALSLIPYFPAESEAQTELNNSLALSVLNKLKRLRTDFSPNEYRIIYASVSLAKGYLSGHIHLEVDSELRAELSKHFFTYNRLEPLLRPPQYN